MNQDYNPFDPEKNSAVSDNRPSEQKDSAAQAPAENAAAPAESTHQNASPSGNEAYDRLMRSNGYSDAWQQPEQNQAAGSNAAGTSQATNPNAAGSARGSGFNPSGAQQAPGYGQPGFGYQQQQNGYYRQNHQAYGAGPGAAYGAPYTQGAYGYGGYQQPAGMQYRPAQQSKPPKQKKYATRAGLVWTLVICLLFSAICGGAGFVVGTMIGKGTGIPGIISGGGTVNINNYTSEPPASSKADGSVAGVVSAVSESVVEISTETVSTGSSYGQYITSGAGSGVIIDQQGYIITCNHVIEGASKITVKLTTGKVYEASIVGSDSETDIAVIKIDAGSDTLKAVEFADSDSLVVGQEIVVIGNPLGSLGGSVTNGIISATDREIEIEGQMYTLLQTNAAINPGNSGGGMFDMNGRLIGIVNAKSSGSDIEGLGFAIPSKNAQDVASQLIAYGYIKGRVKIGIQCFEIQSQEDYMKYWKYSQYITDYGVYIAEAENPDFETGDRIIAFDGTQISTFSDLKALLSKCEVGQKVTITVSRLNAATGKSQLMQIETELTEKTPD